MAEREARFPVPLSMAASDVFVDAAVLPLLLDQLAGDWMTAMAAGHELAGVGQRRGMVDVPAEQRLHPVPGRPVNQRLVLAGIPLSLVMDFANIGPILENVVERGTREPLLRLRPNLCPGVHRSAARAAERRENRMAPVQSRT